MRVYPGDQQEARRAERREEAEKPPLEPQPFVTEEGREIERLSAELVAAQAQLVSKADELAAMQKQRDEARRLYRALLDGIKDAASPREKEGGGA
jgi:small-conductance mechanosensitive channel